MTVGQDLLRLETGAAPSGGASKPESKEPAKQEEKSEAPKQEKPAETESKPDPKPEPKAQESKPAPAPEKKSPTAPPAAKDAPAALGSREERRVRPPQLSFQRKSRTNPEFSGQDESHAPPDRRASQAVSEHRRVVDNLQRGRYVRLDGIPQTVQR